VTCVLYDVEIRVHHGAKWPVIYKVNQNDDYPVINLQCISGIHFNPLNDKNRTNILPDNKNVNFIENCPDVNCVTAARVESKTNPCSYDRDCSHISLPLGVCIIDVFSVMLCALVDTGAQISLLSMSALKLLSSKNVHLNFRALDGKAVNGISGTETKLLGVVDLQPSLLGCPIDEPLPFAVISADDMPCCAILGANFIVRSKLVLDFNERFMKFDSGAGRLDVPLHLCTDANCVNVSYRYVLAYHASDGSLRPSSGDEDADESGNVGGMERFQWQISRNDLVMLQNRDQEILQLKAKVVDNVPAKFWRERELRRFKTHCESLRVVTDLLVIDRNFSVPVIPFSLLVDIVFKVHAKLAHIGRNKLISVVGRQYFHPSLSRVAADICSSCVHCQLYKVSSQLKTPPTIKIKSLFPFDLVAMDQGG